MKKDLLLVLALVSVSFVPYAQTGKSLKSVLELQMPKTAGEDMAGTRGASVVWHPVFKKYYATFAGNEDYPLAMFDKDGKRVSEDDLATMADVRGLWYDAVTKKITGNAYSDLGWFSYNLDENGIPFEAEIVLDGMFQPHDQCVGVYNTAKKQVMFLYGGLVYMYNTEGDLVDSLTIQWGVQKGKEREEDNMMEGDEFDYNEVSMVYTGIKGRELGFLNVVSKQIVLYDISTGYMTKILPLPADVALESMFNFAYANGIYWLFNIEQRKWIGLK